MEIGYLAFQILEAIAFEQDRPTFLAWRWDKLLFFPWLKLGASSLSCRGCGEIFAAMADERVRTVRHQATRTRSARKAGPAGQRSRRTPRAPARAHTAHSASVCTLAHGARRERPHARTRCSPRAPTRAVTVHSVRIYPPHVVRVWPDAFRAFSHTSFCVRYLVSGWALLCPIIGYQP